MRFSGFKPFWTDLLLDPCHEYFGYGCSPARNSLTPALST